MTGETAELQKYMVLLATRVGQVSMKMESVDRDSLERIVLDKVMSGSPFIARDDNLTRILLPEPGMSVQILEWEHYERAMREQERSRANGQPQGVPPRILVPGRRQ